MFAHCKYHVIQSPCPVLPWAHCRQWAAGVLTLSLPGSSRREMSAKEKWVRVFEPSSLLSGAVVAASLPCRVIFIQPCLLGSGKGLAFACSDQGWARLLQLPASVTSIDWLLSASEALNSPFLTLTVFSFLVMQVTDLRFDCRGIHFREASPSQMTISGVNTLPGTQRDKEPGCLPH